MKEDLHVTIVQSNIIWKQKDTNIKNFTKLFLSIRNTDVILLPEMFNTAFCIDDIYLAEEMNGKTINWMKSIAKEKKCAIAGTLMIKAEDKIYNRLVWVTKSGNIYTYDKYHLFSLVNEGKHITKGKNRLILNLEGWKVCPLICYDLRFPVFSRNTVDYDLLIYLANWPAKRVNAWNILLKARSIENQCFTIGVNRVGKDFFGNNYIGCSGIYDPFGKRMHYIKNKQDITTIILKASQIQKQRKKLNFLRDRDDFILT